MSVEIFRHSFLTIDTMESWYRQSSHYKDHHQFFPNDHYIRETMNEFLSNRNSKDLTELIILETTLGRGVLIADFGSTIRVDIFLYTNSIPFTPLHNIF